MPQLLSIILLIIYGGGIWKFWSGYSNTNFSGGFLNRFVLALLWPPLLIVSKSYRQNFNRALKGS
jgi:hypothetical protein